MKFLLIATIVVATGLLQSCGNSVQGPADVLKEISGAGDSKTDLKNFRFNLPDDWFRIDTTLMDSKVALLVKTDEAMRPVMSVSEEFMGIKTHKRYVEDCKQYLTDHMPGVLIKEEGRFAIAGIDCIWFSYNKTQEGITREMVFYSIDQEPVSCNITAGVNPGGTEKYKQTFDRIVKTFHLKK